MYDNKNVDYRHSYYKNLNILNMQKWMPYLRNLYYVVLVLYLVSLLIFNRDRPILEKIKSFIMVAVITNMYVMKLIVSFILFMYYKIQHLLPSLFMY